MDSRVVFGPIYTSAFEFGGWVFAVIQFTFSRQALGKVVDTDERADALKELLKHPIPQTIHDEKVMMALHVNP